MGGISIGPNAQIVHEIEGTFHNGTRHCIERELKKQHNSFGTKREAQAKLREITEKCKKRRAERK